MPVHDNSMECSVGFDYDALDEESNPPDRICLTEADVIEFGRRLISFIRSSPRARMTTDCLYLAFGDADIEGVTMTAVAEKNGVTKAAVSKRTREIREALHLRPNANNKSEHARRTYAHTNCSPLSLNPDRPRNHRPTARSRN